jgi:hypothetical protein
LMKKEPRAGRSGSGAQCAHSISRSAHAALAMNQMVRLPDCG